MKKTKKKEKKPTFQISGLAFEICARMIIIIVVLYTMGTAIVDFPPWQVWLVDSRFVDIAVWGFLVLIILGVVATQIRNQIKYRLVMLWWAINPVWRKLWQP